jgi:hypothetical protein
MRFPALRLPSSRQSAVIRGRRHRGGESLSVRISDVSHPIPLRQIYIRVSVHRAEPSRVMALLAEWLADVVVVVAAAASAQSASRVVASPQVAPHPARPPSRIDRRGCAVPSRCVSLAPRLARSPRRSPRARSGSRAVHCAVHSQVSADQASADSHSDNLENGQLRAALDARATEMAALIEQLKLWQWEVTQAEVRAVAYATSNGA